MISDFNKNYISILGQKHIDYKNGKNWLKYVFLRWFIIDSFFEELKIEKTIEIPAVDNLLFSNEMANYSNNHIIDCIN